MRLSGLLFLLFISLISCDNSPKPIADSRQNDYAFYDEAGGFHRLSRYNNSKAIVLWVQGNGCPIVRNALTDFHQIVTDYSEENIQFFMLNSNIQDDRKEVATEAADFNFQVPVLLDSQQLMADALDITITSEAIILHPVSRKILYRGPLNNRLDYEMVKNEPTETYLRDALDALISNKPIAVKQQMAQGCTVTRASKFPKKDTLNYTRDIAPILKDYCVRCHQDGGIAPWAMTDYQTIAGWSSMIKEVLISKRMPPWKADPEIGSFSNSFAMPDSNARKIINWIDEGLDPGKGADPLVNLPKESTEWKYGTPDEIIVLKESKIPASRLIPYRYEKFKLDVSDDTWIRGIEIQPGNPKVVHHVVLTGSELNQRQFITNRKLNPRLDNYIAVRAGNTEPTFYPESTGVFISKKSTITAQIHYTPTGKPETDQTRIGFYYHEAPPLNEMYALAPSNHNFTIPPHTSDVYITTSDTLTKDIKIHYIAPHMHYRGKRIKFSVISPEGDKKTLVSVPDFNFNWQWMYKLNEPMSVSKGSIVMVEGVFDNSVQNPLNPDPSKELHFGIQSTDEMLIGFFNYTVED